MNIDFFNLFKPEIGLMLMVFLLLIVKIGEFSSDNNSLFRLINILLLAQLVICMLPTPEGDLFNGMVHTSALVSFEKILLTAGTLIISLQSYQWAQKHAHLTEFYILLLTTLLGFYLMISSGNFLMFYLGLELASIPLAALVSFDLDKVKSAEASVKMILSSAFASCIMLFGISFIYGTTGSLQFSNLPQMISGGSLQVLALIFVFSGFAFKLSAVPFHFWTADVYEGAPVPVTAYLSIISKAATVFVFISILTPLFTNLHVIWQHLLEVVIVITISLANLFALRQNNIKRFLAFSSISQAGFILLALISGNAAGFTSAIYFLIIYLFSNLGAFGVIGLVASETGKEEIYDFNGFYKTNKKLSWMLAISLFSLAGVPPTAGFFGKIFLVMSGAESGNYLLVLIAAMNMVVSLYYYLRIVKVVFVNENNDPIASLKGNWYVNTALYICLLGIILTGFSGPLYSYIGSLLSL